MNNCKSIFIPFKRLKIGYQLNENHFWNNAFLTKAVPVNVEFLMYDLLSNIKSLVKETKFHLSNFALSLCLKFWVAFQRIPSIEKTLIYDGNSKERTKTALRETWRSQEGRVLLIVRKKHLSYHSVRISMWPAFFGQKFGHPRSCRYKSYKICYLARHGQKVCQIVLQNFKFFGKNFIER